MTRDWPPNLPPSGTWAPCPECNAEGQGGTCGDTDCDLCSTYQCGTCVGTGWVCIADEGAGELVVSPSTEERVLYTCDVEGCAAREAFRALNNAPWRAHLCAAHWEALGRDMRGNYARVAS